MASEYQRINPSSIQRRRIFLRDNLTCQYCADAEADTYVIDHVVPVAHGGPTEDYNLVTACLACNQKKAAHTWIPLNIEEITDNQPVWRERILHVGQHPGIIITYGASANIESHYPFYLRQWAIEVKCDTMRLIDLALWDFFQKYGGGTDLATLQTALAARQPRPQSEPEPDYEDALQAYAA